MQDKSELDLKMENEIEAFLASTDLKDKYHDLISSKTRFNINLDDVRAKSNDLAKYIMKKPAKAIKMFEEKVNKIVDDLNFNSDNQKTRLYRQNDFPVKQHKLKLTFNGNVGRNFITPRGLKANMINSLVRVQGIVTRMSIVKPKLAKSYHYIPATKLGYVQNYRDQYSVEGQGDYASRMFPTKDTAGNSMSAEYGFCNYSNVQKIIIQEMPERAPTGQIPRSVTIFLEGDVVDKVKPGDRIEVTGVFK